MEPAFESRNYLAIQYLFLGINAHIHLDLGIATSEPMAGKDLHGIQKDFHQINAFLGELVDGLKANISTVSTIFWWLIPLAKR